MSAAQHTPGPWFWHIDSQGRPSLCTPDRGRLVVMDFVRNGMQGATVRFAQWPGIYSGTPRERLGGILEAASHWFNDARGIDHPDAMLIEAAPDLLRELRHAVNLLAAASFTQRCVDIEGERFDLIVEAERMDALVGKATGAPT